MGKRVYIVIAGLIFVLTSSVLLSCSDDPTSSGDDLIGLYPYPIGTTWVYERMYSVPDSELVRFDTVVVEVISETVAEDTYRAVQVMFDYSPAPDPTLPASAGIVGIRPPDTCLTYYKNGLFYMLDGPEGGAFYEFPNLVLPTQPMNRMFWHWDTLFTESFNCETAGRTVATNSLTVPAGTFDDVWQIGINSLPRTVIDTFTQAGCDFLPGVGLIRCQEGVFVPEPTEGQRLVHQMSWVLIEFDLSFQQGERP